MPEHLGKIEMVHDCLGYENNTRMWGKLYVNRTGRTVGGWLLNSWSEHGAPYWTPRMHWFDRGEEKFYDVYLDFGSGTINLHGEDKDIDPQRAKFIQKMMEKWELEWLQDEGKKLLKSAAAKKFFSGRTGEAVLFGIVRKSAAIS